MIGGYVVRDETLGGLTGRYLYGDLCDQALRTLDLDAGGGDPQPAGFSIPGDGGNLRSFGEDAKGCVYVLSNVAVYRVAPDGSTAPACPGTIEPPPTVTYNSYIPHQQVIGKRLIVAAKCSIACTGSATAKVRITRNRFRKEPVIFSVPQRAVFRFFSATTPSGTKYDESSSMLSVGTLSWTQPT